MATKAPAMSPSDAPIEPVLDRATGPRRAEVDELVALFRDLTGEEPVVWAGRIIGYGTVHYEYESGHERINAASRLRSRSLAPHDLPRERLR